MYLLSFDLMDRRGRTQDMGRVVLLPTEIESVVPAIVSGNYGEYIQGAIIKMKSGDSHRVSASVDEASAAWVDEKVET